MAKEFKACALENCNGDSSKGSWGWCSKHYRRYQRHGDPLGGDAFKGLGETCVVAGCDRDVVARGFCGKHYQRFRVYGDPLFAKLNFDNVGKPCKIEGCEKVNVAQMLCAGHYAKLLRYGDPLGGGTPKHARARWIEANRDYIGDDCIKWPFPLGGLGRGKTEVSGVSMTAPRGMCMAAHGKPPTPKHQAAHRCGNGHLACMNPRHLYWATPKENSQDTIRHGRSGRGVRNGRALIGPIDVLGIIAHSSSHTWQQTADEFGIGRTAVGRILHGKAWVHLTAGYI